MQHAAPLSKSVLLSVLEAGGIYPLVLIPLALLLTLWGLINLAAVKSRLLLAAQALLSFVPMAYCGMGLVDALGRFQVLVTAPGPGDPVKIAETMYLTFELGFLGLISTAIPAVVGIFALTRNVRAPASLIRKDDVPGP